MDGFGLNFLTDRSLARNMNWLPNMWTSVAPIGRENTVLCLGTTEGRNEGGLTEVDDKEVRKGTDWKRRKSALYRNRERERTSRRPNMCAGVKYGALLENNR